MSVPVVFSGHRIDEPERISPRFPAGMEQRALAAIQGELQLLLHRHEGFVVGIASLASGGDVLFHECCDQLGIQSTIHLPLPVEQFIDESVASAGVEWTARARQLLVTRQVHRSQGDGGGLHTAATGRNAFEAANAEMLAAAEVIADGDQRYLLALWDGETEGQLTGGTAHMVALARGRGFSTVVIDTKRLLGAHGI